MTTDELIELLKELPGREVLIAVPFGPAAGLEPHQVRTNEEHPTKVLLDPWFWTSEGEDDA